MLVDLVSGHASANSKIQVIIIIVVGGRHAGDLPYKAANGILLSGMARSDSLLIYGLILSTLLNTLRFTSVDKHPVNDRDRPRKCLASACRIK